jgi:hypothetical protein
MKSLAIILGATIFLSSCGGTLDTQGILKDINDVANSAGAGVNTTPTQNEIISGLKQALQQGTNKGSDKLSAVDGFFKDAALKILMPPQAQNVESKLRDLGMGSLVDQAVLSFNRAAENASGQAKPIFINAITQMNFADAMGILKGGGTSATDYLKRTCTNPLTAAFRPTVQQSLNNVNATKYWSDVMNVYNKIPFVTPVNTDLAGYVTDKAIQGIFLKVADEERNIRANPMQQASALLQKVFNYATQK